METFVIEVQLPELRSMFRSIDAGRAKERELTADVEEFIVRKASRAARDATLVLCVHLSSPTFSETEGDLAAQATSAFFAREAQAKRAARRSLLRAGLKSLLIGLTFLALCLGLGQLFSMAFDGGIGELLRESLMIAGWVSLWRPLEVMLYDWWPLRDEAHRLDRLAAMPVYFEHAGYAMVPALEDGLHRRVS